MSVKLKLSDEYFAPIAKNKNSNSKTTNPSYLSGSRSTNSFLPIPSPTSPPSTLASLAAGRKIDNTPISIRLFSKQCLPMQSNSNSSSKMELASYSEDHQGAPSRRDTASTQSQVTPKSHHHLHHQSAYLQGSLQLLKTVQKSDKSYKITPLAESLFKPIKEENETTSQIKDQDYSLENSQGNHHVASSEMQSLKETKKLSSPTQSPKRSPKKTHRKSSSAISCNNSAIQIISQKNLKNPRLNLGNLEQTRTNKALSAHSSQAAALNSQGVVSSSKQSTKTQIVHSPKAVSVSSSTQIGSPTSSSHRFSEISKAPVSQANSKDPEESNFENNPIFQEPKKENANNKKQKSKLSQSSSGNLFQQNNGHTRHKSAGFISIIQENSPKLPRELDEKKEVDKPKKQNSKNQQKYKNESLRNSQQGMGIMKKGSNNNRDILFKRFSLATLVSPNGASNYDPEESAQQTYDKNQIYLQHQRRILLGLECLNQFNQSEVDRIVSASKQKQTTKVSRETIHSPHRTQRMESPEERQKIKVYMELKRKAVLDSILKRKSTEKEALRKIESNMQQLNSTAKRSLSSSTRGVQGSGKSPDQSAQKNQDLSQSSNAYTSAHFFGIQCLKSNNFTSSKSQQQDNHSTNSAITPSSSVHSKQQQKKRIVVSSTLTHSKQPQHQNLQKSISSIKFPCSQQQKQSNDHESQSSLIDFMQGEYHKYFDWRKQSNNNGGNNSNTKNHKGSSKKRRHTRSASDAVILQPRRLDFDPSDINNNLGEAELNQLQLRRKNINEQFLKLTHRLQKNMFLSLKQKNMQIQILTSVAAANTTQSHFNSNSNSLFVADQQQFLDGSKFLDDQQLNRIEETMKELQTDQTQKEELITGESQIHSHQSQIEQNINIEQTLQNQLYERDDAAAENRSTNGQFVSQLIESQPLIGLRDSVSLNGQLPTVRSDVSGTDPQQQSQLSDWRQDSQQQYEIEHFAATIIQKVWRGHFTRVLIANFYQQLYLKHQGNEQDVSYENLLEQQEIEKESEVEQIQLQNVIQKSNQNEEKPDTQLILSNIKDPSQTSVIELELNSINSKVPKIVEIKEKNVPHQIELTEESSSPENVNIASPNIDLIRVEKVEQEQMLAQNEKKQMIEIARQFEKKYETLKQIEAKKWEDLLSQLSQLKQLDENLQNNPANNELAQKKKFEFLQELCQKSEENKNALLNELPKIVAHLNNKQDAAIPIQNNDKIPVIQKNEKEEKQEEKQQILSGEVKRQNENLSLVNEQEQELNQNDIEQIKSSKVSPSVYFQGIKKESMDDLIKMREDVIIFQKKTKLQLIQQMLDSNKLSNSMYEAKRQDIDLWEKRQKEKLKKTHYDIERGWKKFAETVRQTKRGIRFMKKFERGGGSVDDEHKLSRLNSASESDLMNDASGTLLSSSASYQKDKPTQVNSSIEKIKILDSFQMNENTTELKEQNSPAANSHHLSWEGQVLFTNHSDDLDTVNDFDNRKTIIHSNKDAVTSTAQLTQPVEKSIVSSNQVSVHPIVYQEDQGKDKERDQQQQTGAAISQITDENSLPTDKISIPFSTEQACTDVYAVDSQANEIIDYNDERYLPIESCINLNSIKDFLVALAEFIKENFREEFMERVNEPLGIEASEFLKTFSITEGTEPHDTEASNGPIYPIVKYLHTQKPVVSEEIFLTFNELYQRMVRKQKKLEQMQGEGEIEEDEEDEDIDIFNSQSDIEKYNLKLIYDCFNESLDFQRPFGSTGKPMPWKLNQKKLAPVFMLDQEVERVLGMAIGRALKWGSSLCGFITEKIEFPPGTEQENTEYLNQIKEDRLSSMLENEVVECEPKWLCYQEEETDVQLEISDDIFDLLMNEMAQWLAFQMEGKLEQMENHLLKFGGESATNPKEQNGGQNSDDDEDDDRKQLLSYDKMTIAPRYDVFSNSVDTRVRKIPSKKSPSPLKITNPSSPHSGAVPHNNAVVITSSSRLETEIAQDSIDKVLEVAGDDYVEEEQSQNQVQSEQPVKQVEETLEKRKQAKQREIQSKQNEKLPFLSPNQMKQSPIIAAKQLIDTLNSSI